MTETKIIKIKQDPILTKVIFLQRIFKFSCLKVLDPPKFSTVTSSWQETLQDGFDTAAIIFKAIIAKDGAKMKPSSVVKTEQNKEKGFGKQSTAQSVFSPLSPSHPIEVLFRLALRRNVPWIVRAVANAGLDLSQPRPAYGMAQPLWFATMLAASCESRSSSSSVSKKVNSDLLNHPHEIIEALITAGADIDARAPNQTTALYCAIKDAPRAKLSQDDNVTPTNEAQLKSSRDLIQLFLNVDADVQIQNISGETMMHHAVLRTRRDIIKMLLDHFLLKISSGAGNESKIAEERLIFLINTPDADGMTPLHRLCSECELMGDRGNFDVPLYEETALDMMKLFFETPKIAKFVDLNLRDRKKNRNLVQWAIARENRSRGRPFLKVADFLINKCGAVVSAEDGIDKLLREKVSACLTTEEEASKICAVFSSEE